MNKFEPETDRLRIYGDVFDSMIKWFDQYWDSLSEESKERWKYVLTLRHTRNESERTT